MSKKIGLTLFASLGIWLLLAFQFLNGGIPSHYILHDKNMPSLTNAWGALLIPMLTYICTGLHEKYSASPFDKKVIAGWISAILVGIIVSVVFLNNIKPLVSWLGLILLAISLIVRVYQPQYILGFVFGMSVAFGAVLPTAFVLVLALLSATVHLLLYPVIKKMITT
ncbi:hypothetical protein [Alteromonas sp. ASW11-130]|uniref:hypothetical protein n=1 Tax=Alteromonas sp. ASW11-130 TaxID=3015775 RepID=UPI0022419F70|nr:hypothetical protein [Alteromonas sp. ASW11-130]MCW8090749.1 hypothetical protein [Alteromonas sp. ASW11-130]